MIGSARNMLARPGLGERRIRSASLSFPRIPCDERFKTSRHNMYIIRVATSLENLEKSGNFKIVRENLEKAGKNIKESGILNFAQFP